MIWRYRFGDPSRPARRLAYASAPWAGGLASAHVDLMALMPGTDINGALWKALARGGDGSRIAALLCVDPFLRVTDRTALLSAAGIREIVNLPSVKLFEDEAGRALEDTGYGWKQEIAQLARFKDAGFAVNIVVRDRSSIREALKLEPRRLIVHPGLPPVGAARRRSALRRAAELCRSIVDEIPAVSFYRPQGFEEADDFIRDLKTGTVGLQPVRP